MRDVLLALGFVEASPAKFSKSVAGHTLAVDFAAERFEYPEVDGLKVNERQTCNFSANENFVVFECVHRLLAKGYQPRHIELEPRWQVGRGASGGRADVLVRGSDGRAVVLIECKTPGAEFEREWRTMMQTGGQVFSYAQQVSEVQYLALYTSDFVAGSVTYLNYLIKHKDNERLLLNGELKMYSDATSAIERFEVWRDTYGCEHTTKGLFDASAQPYAIGKEKYTIDDLREISEDDHKKKYNEFATILRQHNVSGRENAFDKLVNLFLCKLVDEATNPQDLKFYWKAPPTTPALICSIGFNSCIRRACGSSSVNRSRTSTRRQ